MDVQDIKKNAAELIFTLTHASAALTIIQGIEVGFFDHIPVDRTVTAEELSGQMGYDITRVERWLQFATITGHVKKTGNGYSLTVKGALLGQNTPAPDLLGLFHMVGYFTKAVAYSQESYKKGTGLDSITELKIGRDYIPRVASQLSKTSADCFKQCGVSAGHTILDLGCGDASVLRETIRNCPGVSATGVDISEQTLQLGRTRNIELGLQDQIELRTGDVTDLSSIKDGAYDWVYSINVLPYLPVYRRDNFLKEMVRISRYGVFFNQVIKNNVATLSVEVMLSTLFSDFTGFFTQDEADAFIRKTNIKHHKFLPMIQGESRMVVIFTSRNDIPIERITGISNADRARLASVSIKTAKDLLSAQPAALLDSGLEPEHLRTLAIKLLFP